MKNIHCNAGVVHVSHKGTIHGYGIVWLNIDMITNILSMEKTTKKYPIDYNSTTGDKLIL